MSANIEFMRSIEEGYRQFSGLRSRSDYKIFYGPIFPAPILIMGLNPGGLPSETSQDGLFHKDGSRASASATYFEGMENDVIDCDWPENRGLKKLLLPLVDYDLKRFRNEIVKSNVVFRRSPKVSGIDLSAGMREAAPFVEKILAYVIPKILILTGPRIEDFLAIYAIESRKLCNTIKEPRTHQVVFAASTARFKHSRHELIVAQVAHASRFSWTYDTYAISQKLQDLILTGRLKEQGASGEDIQPRPSSAANLHSTEAPGEISPDVSRPMSARVSNLQLALLRSSWHALGIVPHFHQVHHFGSSKFSGKREPLERFIGWCDSRAIRGENAQTLDRALDVARRMAKGQPLKDAIREAWNAFPLVSR